MNLETKITIYKFTPQVFTLTLLIHLSWRASLNSEGCFQVCVGVSAYP